MPGWDSTPIRSKIRSRPPLAEKLGRASGYGDYSLFLSLTWAPRSTKISPLASFQTGRAKVLALQSLPRPYAPSGATVAATGLIPSICARRSTDAQRGFRPLLNDLEAARASPATREFAAVIIGPHSGKFFWASTSHRTNSCAASARSRDRNGHPCSC